MPSPLLFGVSENRRVISPVSYVFRYAQGCAPPIFFNLDKRQTESARLHKFETTNIIYVATASKIQKPMVPTMVSYADYYGVRHNEVYLCITLIVSEVNLITVAKSDNDNP